MKTRIQKLLVAAALLSTATLVHAQFNYTDNGNGTCTITGYTGPGGAVTIPHSIAGLIVVGIGNNAFYNKSFVTNVTIADSVTSIGDSAFYGTYLTSVIIPDSVTAIGAYAFSDTGLTSAIMGSGLITIGQQAFAACAGLTSVTIPNSVTNIGDAAFDGCISLTNLIVGNGVTSIGYDAFFGCQRLASVTIPAGVTNLGPGAFGGCYAMTAIRVDAANSFYSTANGVVFDKNQTTLIEFPAGRGGSYAIPASVTNIGDYAFIACTSLTNVTIRSGVARIGSGAFGRCTSLASVTIPATVNSIGYRAFYNCTSLRAAYFLGNAPSEGLQVFKADFGYDPVIVYYLSGTSGWGPFFSGVPTQLWNPQPSALGVTGGHFGFNINGPSNTVVLVEACTNLAQPVWLPVSTNALDGSGASSFSDSESSNYPARFYRIRSP